MNINEKYPNHLLIYLMFHHIVLPRHFYVKKLNKKWYLIKNKELEEKLEKNVESQYLDALKKIVCIKTEKEEFGKWKWLYKKCIIKNFGFVPKW